MKRVALYVQAAVLRAYLLATAVLVTLFSLLDFVEQLRDVGTGRYGLFDALQYVLLSAPSRLFTLAPIAALFAALLALGALAASGELTAIRAAGTSPRRVSGWVMQAGVLVIVGVFLVAQFVIPPCQRRAEFDRANKLNAAEAFRSINGFWARGPAQFLNVRQFAGGVSPEDLDIYRFDEQARLVRFIHAARADILKDGSWHLHEVLIRDYDPAQVRTERLDSLVWQSFLRPSQVQLLTLPPESMAPLDLLVYVLDLRRQNQETGRYEQGLWAMVMVPLAIVAMLLLAPNFVSLATRGQTAGQRLILGGLLGMAYSLVQQITGRLTLMFGLPPVFSAIAPVALLLLLIAVLVLREPLQAFWASSRSSAALSRR